MHPFDYVAAESVAEAVERLGRDRAEAKVLAGGQSLVPLLTYRLARPRIIVDINSLPLDGIAVADGHLRLGALTRHWRLLDSPEVARACPLLRDAAALIGNVRVRSLGTVGGSLAHADPAGELPLVAVTLDARITAEGPGGRRTHGAGAFFTGALTTALGPADLLTEVVVPSTRGQGWAIEEEARRAGDFAMVAVAVVLGVDRRGRVTGARVGFGGVGPAPVRSRRAEEALEGQEPTGERLTLAAERAQADIAPESDAFVSADYRRLLARVLMRRALGRAVARALEAA